MCIARFISIFFGLKASNRVGLWAESAKTCTFCTKPTRRDCETKWRCLSTTQRRRSMFLTFISTYGVLENEHSRDLVDWELGLGELFGEKILI